MNLRLTFGSGLFAAALAISTQAGAATYDAALDFSTTANPNSPWSYGYEASLGGTFTAFATPFRYVASAAGALVEGWAKGGQYWYDYYPHVVKNTTGVAYDDGLGFTVGSGQLEMAPGFGGDAVVRFTAPAAGTYELTSLFSADQNGFDGVTSTDVHILVNGSGIFSSGIGIPGYPSLSESFAGSVVLAAGDTVDFAVGQGVNSIWGDSTGFGASLTSRSVPEGLPLPVAWLALVGVLALRRCKAFGSRAA